MKCKVKIVNIFKSDHNPLIFADLMDMDTGDLIYVGDGGWVGEKASMEAIFKYIEQMSEYIECVNARKDKFGLFQLVNG